MKYKETSATGNAGEFYFAYWISRYFQWPCRLLDIDIGIDAQIEILDEHNHSRGEFIAVQIKTTLNDKKNKSIDLDNLEYWKTINDPVILVFIKINDIDPKIYWREINTDDIDSHIELAQKNTSKTISIDFNESHRLSKKDKERFSLLPYKGSVQKIKGIHSEIQRIGIEICDFLIDINDECSLENINGQEDIDDNLAKFVELKSHYDEFEKIINHFPKLKKHDLSIAIEKINSNVSGCVQNLFNQIKDMSYELFSEYKSQFSISTGDHR